jgi:hypothetical protein
MYFSFSPTFCAIYRLQARKFNARSGKKISCRIRAEVLQPLLSPRAAAQLSDAITAR